MAQISAFPFTLPIFLIKNASSPASTSTTAGTSISTAATFTASTTTSSPSTSNSSVTPSPTVILVQNDQNSTSGGLSTGARAGIDVEVSIAGIICIAALGWWIVRRRRQGSEKLVHNSTQTYQRGIQQPELLDSRELGGQFQFAELPT